MVGTKLKSDRSPLYWITPFVFIESPPSCVFLLFFCVRLPCRQMVLLPLSVSWFGRFPQLWFIPFSLLMSSGQPCLVPVSIFRADIFSFSRRHPCPVMLWFWLNLPERVWCWHRLCIHGRDTGHHCCYGCHSIFKAGFAYFSVANLTQAAHGKYHVVIPAEIWRQPSAFSS